MIFSIIPAATFILLLQSPAALTPDIREKIIPQCTVSGRVVSSVDGTPLKSSRVALLGEHESREPQLYTATSDRDGRFTIKDVPAGRYHFYATHTGYVDQEYQSRGSDTGAILALQPAQEIKDVMFRLTPAAVITGRVSDEDGDPMGLIEIVALRRPSDEELEEGEKGSARPEWRAAATAQTDDRGQFRIFGLKPGEYYIQAKDQYDPQGMIFGHDWEIRRSLGSEYAPAYYPGVTQFAQAEAVNVGAGEEAQADFIMRRVKTVQLSGRVIAADGKPANDVFIYLEELPADYGMFQGNAVDAKGEFKIKGVVPGSYIMHAQQHSGEDTSYQASQKLDVGNENIDSITLALGRGVTFVGKVEVSGSGTLHLDQLFLSLFSHDEQSQGAWARVKKDGTFTLADVSDGNYGFSINGLDPGWYVKAIRSGATEVLRKGLDVEKEFGAGGIIRIVVANDGAQLEGSVKQSDKPVTGARVRLRPEPETPYDESLRQITSTDQSGRFSFVGIAPGQYRVTAKITGAGGTNALASDPQTLNLSEREHKSIELTLPEPQPQ